ncbi:MAG: mechanosensitive ion channel family protein [Anaerolineales bacterium]|jgi:small conductance mechanosensitive channel
MDIDFSPAVEQIQEMINAFIKALPNIAVALVVFLIFYLVGWITRTIVRSLATRSRRPQNLALVLGRLAQMIVVVLGTLIALVIIFPNFSPGELIQLLGLGSIAIGFAFRDIFENFLGGIILLLNEPFRTGDQINIKEYEGTVEEIETRSTNIRTYDNRRVVIPNADILTNMLTVNTAFPQRRVDYEFGIGYGDDIERAKLLAIEAMREVEGILAQPAPDVIVTSLGDSSVILRARWWIAPPRRSDANDSRDLVLSAIKRKLSANGIDLPFPTQQILFHDQTEETDGDRTRQREGWPAGPGGAPAPRRIGLWDRSS